MNCWEGHRRRQHEMLREMQVGMHRRSAKEDDEVPGLRGFAEIASPMRRRHHWLGFAFYFINLNAIQRAEGKGKLLTGSLSVQCGSFFFEFIFWGWLFNWVRLNIQGEIILNQSSMSPSSFLRLSFGFPSSFLRLCFVFPPSILIQSVTKPKHGNKAGNPKTDGTRNEKQRGMYCILSSNV